MLIPKTCKFESRICNGCNDTLYSKGNNIIVPKSERLTCVLQKCGLTKKHSAASQRFMLARNFSLILKWKLAYSLIYYFQRIDDPHAKIINKAREKMAY